ncbi:hypothetical protein RHGRI_022258 [Rhododendron griersonianum]|uniref:Uncharacterized protein n=1 Tax=Rhododendron griersonianum TaxID=479676 RepID=A0AAV6J2N6_9ERIC|nr:hypothetical protein RHGRI_022258 [Rhododendron griersonianum]
MGRSKLVDVGGKDLVERILRFHKDQNVIAVFPKLALENEYRIQLKPREYPSRGVKALTYNISGIKPAVTEDKANEDPLTKTGKSSSAEIKVKKRLFLEDDNAAAASELTFESPCDTFCFDFFLQLLRLHSDLSDSSQQRTVPESFTTSAENTGWLTLRFGIFAGTVVLTGIGVLVYLKRSNL